MNRLITPLSLIGVSRGIIPSFYYRSLSNITPKPTINTIVDKHLYSTMAVGLISSSLLTAYGYDQLGFAIMLSSLWGGLIFQYQSKN